MDKIDGKTARNASLDLPHKLLFNKINPIFIPSYPQAKHFLDSDF